MTTLIAISLIGGVVLYNSAAGQMAIGFIGMLVVGIVVGSFNMVTEATKFEKVPSEIISIDRRCVSSVSGINRFSDMPSNSCSPQDIADRLVAVEAPAPAPIKKNAVVTNYPAKRMPEPGAAFVKVKYIARDSVLRYAELRFDASGFFDRQFYDAKVGQTLNIMVCKRDPAIVKSGLVGKTDC